MDLLITGQYPRSEPLISATRDFDRNRIKQDALQQALQKDFQDFMELQKNLNHKSPGYFHWQDLLRPYAELITSTQASVLTRFFETNTFWRRLQGKGKPRLNLEPLESWANGYFFANGALAADAPLVFTVPFLFLFKEFSSLPIELISELLEAVVKHLKSFPNKIICFYEPTLGWRPITKEEKKAGVHLLTRLKGSIPLFLVSSFFPIEKESHFLYNLPLDGIGIDFSNNSLKTILKEFPQDKSLIAGILSCDTTRIEEKGTIQQVIKTLEEHLPPEQIYIGPSGPCELLPRTVMDAKIKQIEEIFHAN